MAQKAPGFNVGFDGEKNLLLENNSIKRLPSMAGKFLLLQAGYTHPNLFFSENRFG